jgi:membrane protease YdiL (CAAX protease family)
MSPRTRIFASTAAIFALFHVIVVVAPILTSGASGETQAFAVAIFDLPIFWLLGLFPAGRQVLYGSSSLLYTLLFVVGGTLMYAAVGALVGSGIHVVIRAFRGN